MCGTVMAHFSIKIKCAIYISGGTCLGPHTHTVLRTPMMNSAYTSTLVQQSVTVLCVLSCYF